MRPGEAGRGEGEAGRSPDRERIDCAQCLQALGGT